MRDALAAMVAGALLALGASGAQAQPTSSADQALAGQTLTELLGQSKVLMRPGLAKTVILMTPIRASASTPGVCEYDVLEIERPGTWTPADAPSIRSVRSERWYRLIAVEPLEAFRAEVYADRDRRCRNLESEGRAGFYTSERADDVWIAGQLIVQAAGALGKPAFERIAPRLCAPRRPCPSPAELRRLLEINSLRAVHQELPCPRDQLCLRALLADDEGGELSLWQATLRVHRVAWGKWRLRSLSLERQPIISLADDAIEDPYGR